MVTLLFADLVGSTALGEQLDPEAFETILRQYASIAREAVTGHGGTIEKFAGDGVMAAFGVPTLHEDDALRAARAAIDLRAGVAGLAARLAVDFPVELDLRIAVHTGEVVTPEGSEDRLVAGDTANTAARLQSAAAPGEILLGPTTASLLADAATTEPVGPISLKGKAQPVPAFRLLSVNSDAEAIARRLDSPLVGRRAELAALEQAFDEVVEGRTPRIVTVVGQPGIGKSRLVAAFAASVRDRATIHRGRCLPYGDGIAYWPIRELVFDAAGVSASDDVETARRGVERAVSSAPDGPALAARLQALFSLNEQIITAAEIPFVIRRTLEALASERPLVAIFDDIQWAEPALLDVLENVADLSIGSPILLLTIARPELVELRPEWFARADLLSIRLEALPLEDTATLVANLLGQDATTSLGARVAETAEGNPLFVEQLVAMVRDGGDIAVPASIQALLGARLDALPLPDRAVLQRGSVVGRTFWWSSVSQLSPEPDREGIGSGLARLVRRDFLRPDRSIFDGDEAYRFRHLLVRDAAYASLAKSDRAELHAGFGDWLADRVGDRVDEYAEILGYHFEQSYEYLRATPGPTDGERDRVRDAAARWLADAARRARARGDARAAAKLGERVLRLSPLPDPRSRILLPEFIDSLIDLGDLGAAKDWLAQGAAAAHEANDELLDAWCGILRSRLKAFTREEDAANLSEEALLEISRVFERHGDDRGLSRVARVRAGEAWALGRMAVAAKGFEAAAFHAQRGGFLAEAAHHRAFRLSLLSMGPAPIVQVLREVDAALAAGTDLRSEAELRYIRATSLASGGRFDEARVEFRQAHTTMVGLGHQMWAEVAGQLAGFIETQAGDNEGAIDVLERSFRALEAMGERAYSSTTVALLADVLCEVGQFERALEMSHVSQGSSDPDDVMTEALWRSARARALAHQGQARDAEQLMEQALELAATTDMIGFHGEIWRHAADLRSALGRSTEEQSAALLEADRLFTEKGWAVMSDRMRQRLGELASGRDSAG